MKYQETTHKRTNKLIYTHDISIKLQPKGEKEKEKKEIPHEYVRSGRQETRAEAV
jgi:hypothetical protein